MGVACILNARRCGRTHCRYTGPFYLAMIAPVFWLAAGIGSVGFLGWLLLGVLILAGSKIIWWATEHASGKFSSQGAPSGPVGGRILLCRRVSGSNWCKRRPASANPIA
jgi:hypothetical protein